MIASGWSNRTPWDTHREEDEEQLKVRYETMISKLQDPHNAVFNIHVPPYRSSLDEAPELDKDLRPKMAGQALKPVGSTALRKVIEEPRRRPHRPDAVHQPRFNVRTGNLAWCPCDPWKEQDPELRIDHRLVLSSLPFLSGSDESTSNQRSIS
jgi:hypothetical protein